MQKLLIQILIILAICYPLKLLAIDVHYEEDRESSKKQFIISGVPRDDSQVEKGVMTLCFKPSSKKILSFDHPCLLFEMFLSATPEISLRMIHWGANDDRCGRPLNPDVRIEGEIDTLKKVYRAKRVPSDGSTSKYMPATYYRYASWIIDNTRLRRGLTQAEDDCDSEQFTSSTSTSCVKYAVRIMETVGLKTKKKHRKKDPNVNFGPRLKIFKNLKFLVDNRITPKPYYTANTFPEFEFNESREEGNGEEE